MTCIQWRDQICQKILDGLRAACDDTVVFTEDFSRPIDAEYLAAVYVAKQIATLNTGLGYPLKIYLEMCAESFKAECTPLLASVAAANLTGKKLVPRSRTSIGRSGRIDVAVMRDGELDRVPVCAIEMKAFNPSRARVVADLRRNAEYFESGSTGASQIEFVTLAAVRSYYVTESRESKARKTFEGYAATVPPPSGVNMTVEVATLRAGSVDEDGQTPQLIAGLITYANSLRTGDA